MGRVAQDLRFRASTTGMARAAIRRWWALVPSALLGTVGVFERVAGFPVSPPHWLIWVLFAASIALVVVLAHHDVRVVALKALEKAEGERDAIQAHIDGRSAVARQRVETFKRLLNLRSAGAALSDDIARLTDPREMFSDSDMAARVATWSREVANAVSHAGWDLAAVYEATVSVPTRLDPTETRMPLQQSLDVRLAALEQILNDLPQKLADFHEVGTS